jgi:hypothetical protein
VPLKGVRVQFPPRVRGQVRGVKCEVRNTSHFTLRTLHFALRTLDFRLQTFHRIFFSFPIKPKISKAMKKLFLTMLVAIFAMAVLAQNPTPPPYNITVTDAPTPKSSPVIKQIPSPFTGLPQCVKDYVSHNYLKWYIVSAQKVEITKKVFDAQTQSWGFAKVATYEIKIFPTTASTGNTNKYFSFSSNCSAVTAITYFTQ